MIEENFNAYNSIPGDNSPGMLTFGEYLDKKDELLEFFSTEKYLGMPTFLEYLESKNVLVEIVEDAKLEDKIRDIMEVMESEVLSNNVLKDLDLLINKNLDFKTNLMQKLEESQASKDLLWETYVNHINKKISKYKISDIQNPKILYESRTEHAKQLIIEQRRIHDRIYFFSPGGGYYEEDEGCAVIGRAVIGKNKIC